MLDEDASVSAKAAPGRSTNPTVAFELAATSGFSANPYLEHQGWEFKTGAPTGVRLQAHLIGILLGYEYTRASNSEVCSGGCFEGRDMGSTTMQALEVGFRLRIQAGPVRPFGELAFGGVIAKSGDWSAETSESVYGGQARGAIGVEYPFAGRFFASGSIGYKFVVTESPLKDDAEEELNAAILGIDPSAGDAVEDAHVITFGVGMGVER
jgi:hypothetical protein